MTEKSILVSGDLTSDDKLKGTSKNCLFWGTAQIT